MQKQQYIKMTWLKEVETALNAYQQQPLKRPASSSSGQHSGKANEASLRNWNGGYYEEQMTKTLLFLVEQQIRDTKDLIRHCRAGDSYPNNSVSVLDDPLGEYPPKYSGSFPTAQHNSEKALHQYRRQLDKYEHLKGVLQESLHTEQEEVKDM